MKDVVLYGGLFLVGMCTIGAFRSLMFHRQPLPPGVRYPEPIDYRNRQVANLVIVIAVMAWGWWLTYYFMQ